MHRDGRFNPLELLAEIIALATVLLTALVTWWRHPKPAPTPPHVFRECKNVTGPGPYYR